MSEMRDALHPSHSHLCSLHIQTERLCAIILSVVHTFHAPSWRYSKLQRTMPLGEAL